MRLLASPEGVAERSESFKMMIAGGNHTVIKKLLSVARLMRGGERLKSPQQYIEWCNLEHMPLIQLHSLTNLSPPLISHDKISVPKCR